ncbi:hypothetical protein LGV61_05765 [Desulfurispirillum indicum]|uniref:Outer membrane protein beta-barrel domain-containing protein n=1 Tax=Desulfurispirillum indicum (strain ATCC BAA-1389 / DSM 22839 / S5) TaxID=653733 RepID=E6W3X2_DESIS|nr:hypothetical protein [Desulfurispirillum indicum]ADU65840.1 hypothetical protein Selin_1105 [Desulfurispirillum indicum S5]UCZ57776.1 hypothetical protein LGV61_05765 [Desulfurispirillum indicum]
MKRFFAPALVVALLASPLWAKDISIEDFLTESEPQKVFRSMSEDIGAAFAYRSVAPAYRLGGVLPGFELGADVSVSSLNNTGTWGKVGENDFSSSLPLARLTAQVGLPFIPLDFGVAYTSVPSSDLKLMGYELRYSIWDGGALAPALAARLSHSKLSGVDDLSFDTTAVEVGASYDFAIITPYVNAGMVKVTSDPDGVDELDKETFSLKRFTVGARIAIMPLVGVTVEADTTGDVRTLTAKIALRF